MKKGKLMGLPLNRALFDDDGHIYDIVSGNFLIVGLGEKFYRPFPGFDGEIWGAVQVP